MVLASVAPSTELLSAPNHSNDPSIARKLSTTLVIPTWNEIDGMRAIMPLIGPDWVDQILILDGGSTDGTIEWAREQGYEVYVQQRPGLRHAYCEALPFIKGDVILTFSPDGNSLPEAIPALLEKMRAGYDMVIASRYLPPASSKDDDWLTALGNWFFNRAINLLHRARYTDAMVMLRAYRKSLVSELELDQDRWYRVPEYLFQCHVSWEPLLSIRAARRRLNIAEVPADEPARLGGVRKLKIWRWGATYLYQTLRDFVLFH